MVAYKKSSKKGLSPLIAAVLLIVFTIGIATIIISWVNTYTKDVTYSATEGTEDVLDCANTNVDIEDIYIITSDNVKVIARNTGMKPIYLKDGYIMDTNGTRCFLNFSTDAIDKGASVELVNTSCTSIDFTADCLEFDKAVVSTTCGVVAIFTDASDVSCNIA